MNRHALICAANLPIASIAASVSLHPTLIPPSPLISLAPFAPPFTSFYVRNSLFDAIHCPNT